MSYFVGLCLLFSLVLSSCVHSKNQRTTLPVEAANLAILAKAKNIGEVFKAHFDDPTAPLIDLLSTCADPKSNETCDGTFEKSVADRLRILNLSLPTKNTLQILKDAKTTGSDFHKLVGLYMGSREYIVPVAYEAWLTAVAVAPYSKAISSELFSEVKSIRKILDNRSPKPVGYYFLVALETENQKAPMSEKVQAYKRCIDEEPSNRRCQESYLLLAGQSPKAILISEANLAKECRPEVDKSGFSLRVGTSASLRSFNGPKPFLGKKYYFDRQDILTVSEIQSLHWIKKGQKVNLELTDAGLKKLKAAASRFKNKSLLLMKKETIFAAIADFELSETSKVIHFTEVDAKMLAELIHQCP